MTKTLNTFSVIPKGVGRMDYSSAVAIAVESAISIWQRNFSFQDVVTVPAAGSLVVEVDVEAGMVAVIGDFFASIPSNHLVRLEVIIPPPAVPVAVTAYSWIGYQQVQVHLKKPNFYEGGVRMRVYNYMAVDQPNMLVGCSGYLATTEEYTQLLEGQR